jgi:hypothetical protein
VSAQIIAALRKRADVLTAEADEIDAPDGSARMPAAFLRFLAAEFRAVADEAEGREPPDGEIEP